MQINFNDKTARSNTVQDIKYFKSQPSATQVKKVENIVF